MTDTLFQVFCDLHSVGESFADDLAAANLPEVTEEEAIIFAEGDSDRITALLQAKPALQVVEDFLGRYAF